jgi:hypothetical protein
MGHLLLAVLVPAAATVETIDVHLDRILEPRLGTLDIDDYRLGGGFTGAWDPGYDPTRDPANHETCNRCHGRQQDQGDAAGYPWLCLTVTRETFDISVRAKRPATP